MKINCKYIHDLRINSLGDRGKCLTIYGLANETDLYASNIHRLETDEKYNPSISTLYKLAKYYNISIDSFILD